MCQAQVLDIRLEAHEDGAGNNAGTQKQTLDSLKPLVETTTHRCTDYIYMRLMPAISHAPTSQQRYCNPLQISSTEHSRSSKAPLSRTCCAAVTQPPHNLGSHFQDAVPHGGDMKAAVMRGS